MNIEPQPTRVRVTTRDNYLIALTPLRESIIWPGTDLRRFL